MTRVHTVSVELLRQGDPHNQLLSKATEYTALCGNRAPEPVRLPFDHFEQELRLSRLSYRHIIAGADSRSFEREEEARRSELVETSRLMGELLGSIPGLGEGLARAEASDAELTHLRLVVTPHELSLLPFESANTGQGQGLKLLLQPDAPICMTREVRGVVPDSRRRWPTEPKVLFAWAAPQHGSVPFKAHLLALRRALRIWIEPERSATSQAAKNIDASIRSLEKVLTVLPFASLQDIHDCCAKNQFTHVHILAHGAAKTISERQRSMGLALHNRRDPDKADVVSGERLANALRFRRADGALPTMVTLAACDSAGVESVVLPGGSIAHALHVAGVPVVVASQFPLSFEGSVVIATEFYRRVLEGDDVRTAVYHVRRKLFSDFDDYHDWASLVTYCALPDNYRSSLDRFQHKVRYREVDRLLDDADCLESSKIADVEQRFDKILSDLDRYSDPENYPDNREVNYSRVLGLCASTQKRTAQLLWSKRNADYRDVDNPSPNVPNTPQPNTDNRKELQRAEIAALQRARRLYRQGMRHDIGSYWTATQYLSLTRVLYLAELIEEDYTAAEWTATQLAAEFATDKPDRRIRGFGHAALCELHLLAKDPAAMKKHAVAMLKNMDPGRFPLYSTRRQFQRYRDWWSRFLEKRPPALDQLGELAEQVLELIDRHDPSDA